GRGTARWGTPAALEDPTKYRQGAVFFVAPDFFNTVRAQLIAGRTFNAADEVLNTRTVIIDDRAAALAFPNESAIGKTIWSRPAGPDPLAYEVIGVVKHLRHTTLVGDEAESIYFSNGSFGSGANGWML